MSGATILTKIWIKGVIGITIAKGNHAIILFDAPATAIVVG